jgi:tRNA(Ile)-lysidine synthase
MTPQNKIHLEKRFLKEGKRLLKRGERILLAISGGLDSMVMLQLFLDLKDKLGVTVGVAHVHHGLRGKFSDHDAAFVKNFCIKRGLAFWSKKVPVRRMAKNNHWSLEEAARNLRYQALEEIAKNENFGKICTAHHQGDQAETVLMRIIKGTGWQGLSGIREQRGKVVRPMLVFSKEEILNYAKKTKLKFVSDASNADTVFFRNRIRHRLLPMIKKQFDPQVEKHLQQLGFIAGETRRWLYMEAERLFKRHCRADETKIVLEIKRFNKYLFIQRQSLIELIFERLGGTHRSLVFSDFSRIVEFIESAQRGKRLLFEENECVKYSDRVVFQRTGKGKSAGFAYAVESGLSYDWPKIRFESRRVSPAEIKLGRSKYVEYLDPKKITGQLILRSWKAGDYFFPLGMTSSKKLSDFFIDNKIPNSEKLAIPILCEQDGANEHVIWICGYRLDERYKIDPSTKQILKVECHSK